MGNLNAQICISVHDAKSKRPVFSMLTAQS